MAGAIPSILATLGGNPFNTPVGQKIEQATDASLASENWALNMEICDTINDTDEGPKDAVKAIKKRLHQNMGKNYTVVLYTLTVLETCVKNCGRRFHLLISQKDFTSELVKLIGPKNDPPLAIQDRILSLIQSWADAFQGNPEMQGVVQVHQELKQKNVEFPMTDLDAMAPIITPQRRVLSNVPCSNVSPPVPERPPMESELPGKHLPARISPATEAAASQSSVTSISQEQIVKLKSELEIVQKNINIFGEMLTELTPGHEHPEDLQLLLDLQKTCYAMQSRIVALIDRVGVEEITSELLQSNDDLNNLFVRFERYEKKRQAVTAARGDSGSYEISVPPVMQPHKEPVDKPLIDFGEASSSDITSQLQELNIASGGNLDTTVVKRSLSPTEEAADEFDMFAQSRNVTYEGNKARGSSYEDNTNLNQMNQGLASFAQSKGQPNLNEEDAQNLAIWLNEKPVTSVEAENPVPNPEFERFLERRAHAVNYCPSPESGAINRRNVETKNPPEDSMFTL